MKIVDRLAKRPCDYCSIKVIHILYQRRKCNRERPCAKCVEKKLTCTYGRPQLKRGPPFKKERAGNVVGEVEVFGGRGIETAIVRNRDHDLRTWTCFTFFTISILDQDGHLLLFHDYYYKYVYNSIPGLPRSLVVNRMADIPLYLLHSMYALCLIYPSKKTMRESALKHYYYSLYIVNEKLEDADPYTISAILHLSNFALDCSLGSAGKSLIALAVKICQYLKMTSGVRLIWKSPIGTTLRLSNFQNSLLILCFIKDSHIVFFAGLPSMFDSIAFADRARLQFVCPKAWDGGEQQDNALTYFEYCKALCLCRYSFA